MSLNQKYKVNLELLKEKFEQRVIKVEDGCWSWKPGKFTKKISTYPKIIGISNHIASWLIHRGTIENDLLVLHRCDNKQCSSPEHLYLGTAKDNSLDVYKKEKTHFKKVDDELSLKRISIETDIQTLKHIKSVCAQNDISMRKWIMEAIAEKINKDANLGF